VVDQRIAEEQIRRLGGTNNYPIHMPEAWGELVKAALTANTETALRKAIDSLLYDSDDCPKPADLYRVIAVENDRINESTLRPPKPKCSKCGGLQFISGTYLVTRHYDQARDYAWKTCQLLTTDVQIKAVRQHLQPTQEIYDGSEMCECHPGYIESQSNA
jgi:hypothetical protein